VREPARQFPLRPRPGEGVAGPVELALAGEDTAEVLGLVTAGPIPSPAERNPEVPEAVVQIVARALERDPERRYTTAGEMGEACEHFLYDKGYGPTNLTLKRYLAALFDGAGELRDVDQLSSFPVIEATLIPIDDGLPKRERDGVSTRVAAPRPPDTES